MPILVEKPHSWPMDLWLRSLKSLFEPKIRNIDAFDRAMKVAYNMPIRLGMAPEHAATPRAAPQDLATLQAYQRQIHRPTADGLRV